MPCHAKAGQRSPRAAAQRSACTVHAPAPPLWLTHAQRKRTDDGDSPPWLYPTATPESRWRPDTPSSSPKGQTGAHSVSHCACTAALRHATVFAQKKMGENQAPLQRVVGAFVHKRREDGSEGLTTLHTTPHQSPHRAVPIAARAHSLSHPVFTSPESSRALAAMAAAPLLLLLLLAMFTASGELLRICTLLLRLASREIYRSFVSVPLLFAFKALIP